MTDFSNSVIMPREDFIELQEAAWAQTPPTAGERIGNTVQTTLIVAGCGVAFAGATWGWAKAMDWLEDRRFRRAVAQAEKNTKNPYEK